MSTPGDMLLDKLVRAYRKQHELYRTSRSNLRLFGALLGLALVVAPLLYLWQRSADWSGALFVFALGFAGVLSLWHKMNRSKKELSRLKKELEGVGLRIACNSEDPYEPRIEIIREGENKENHVLLPRFQDIDFAHYNRLFRIESF